MQPEQIMIRTNMYILHIETSTKICSVAISQGREIVAIREDGEGMNHTALLTPYIEELFKDIGIGPRDLSAISISSGPGSYTGLRVGGSTAKAIAYSLRIPLLAVPTLLSLASAGFEKHQGAQFAMPMIDARRKEVYTAIYNKELLIHTGPFALILDLSLADLIPQGDVVICGDGAEKVMRETISHTITIDSGIRSSASHLVLPAMAMFESRQFSDPLHFVPFYLKPPNITQARAAM